MPARLVLALAFLAVPALSLPAAASDETRRVTVVGQAEIRAAPDIARLQSGVTTDAETAAEAVRENSQAVQAMLDALREAGIAARDLQTSGFSVQPRYVHPRDGNGEPRLVGYRVGNTVSVTIRDLGALGEILDAVVQAGANEVSGLAFDIADKREMLDRARAEAVRDARRKAELYAEAAGAALGEVRTIDERSVSEPPRPAYRSMAMEAADASVPIETGEQALRAEVTVVWRLED